MKILRSNKQYANIRTMQELRSARERLAWQIEMSEQNMDREYNGLREMFTIGHFTAALVRKFESIRSWISTMIDGYHLALSLFNRKEQSFDRQEADQSVETSDDQDSSDTKPSQNSY